jgi:hypothetical protein
MNTLPSYFVPDEAVNEVMRFLSVVTAVMRSPKRTLIFDSSSSLFSVSVATCGSKRKPSLHSFTWGESLPYLVT